MSSSVKRVFTENDARVSFSTPDASSHGLISADLTAQLRGVGSRVRKSVTQGYATPPSFTKSQSTGNIFRSANDTLRDVYASAQFDITYHPNSPRKRSRSVSDRGDESRIGAEPSGNDDNDMQLDDESDMAKRALFLSREGRIVKPLRKLREGMTLSLPNGLLRFSDQRKNQNGAVPVMNEEEEDWSLDNPALSAIAVQDPSEPVVQLM